MNPLIIKIMYFQSMLSLYHNFPPLKRETVIAQLKSYQNEEDFFNFLSEKIDQGNLSLGSSETILNISIDYLLAIDNDFKIKNQKNFVQYLLKLFNLKVNPLSFDNYLLFLQKAFKLFDQSNQDFLFHQLSKYSFEQSILPFSALSQINHGYSERVLNTLLKSFAVINKNITSSSQILKSWILAMTNFLENNVSSDVYNKSICPTLDIIMNEKLIVTYSSKIKLINTALHFLNKKEGNKFIVSHSLNLLSSISIASPIDDVILAMIHAKNVILRMKQYQIENLSKNDLVNCVFKYIMPAYRTERQLNIILLDFFNEVDQEIIQSVIKQDITSNNISLSTLFFISRYPTSSTIPILLSKYHVDNKSQYIMLFYFLSHNSVPFRYLPRLFDLLQADDLHFLNEIFEQKPQLYCTAALKFLSQCKIVEKIEFIAFLFAKAKSLPIISSPYAINAFLTVACYRAYSKTSGCPIRLLLDYIQCCIYGNNSSLPLNSNNVDDPIENNDNLQVDHKLEYTSDGEDEKEKSPNKVDNPDEEQIEKGLGINLNESIHDEVLDPLDMANDDISSLSIKPSEFYNVAESYKILNRSTFCQAQAIQEWSSKDNKVCQDMIDISLQQIKSGNTLYAIIIGSLSNDPVLIHNCVQTLAQSDLFLLTFFFTTAASCNPEIILKEMKLYIQKDPDSAPQSFVSRLFSARPSTASRRQRIARRCIIGMAPYVPFSQTLYDVLIASIPSNDNSSQNVASLTCEAVIAVCSRLSNREVLHSLLDKIIFKCSDFLLDDPMLVPAIVCILKSNQNLTDNIAIPLVKLWVKLILNSNPKIMTNENCNKWEFEKTFLSFPNALPHYIKEIESAIRTNGDFPGLFASLKRAISVSSNFELKKYRTLVTLIMANCLSNNEDTLEFCVNILRKEYDISSQILSLSGSYIFSHDYCEVVCPFFNELASKFKSAQLVTQVEELLKYYSEISPENKSLNDKENTQLIMHQQTSVFLFAYYSIKREPQSFIKNKFVTKIVSICDKLTRKNDYAAMLYLFRALDALNSSNNSIFFNELLEAPNNEFVSLYIERYARHSESVGSLLIPKIIELKSINKKWKNFLTFQRMLNLFSIFTRSFVRDTTSYERLAGIIFCTLLQLSTINIIRNRGINVNIYLSILSKSIQEFRNSTGIVLLPINDDSNSNDSRLFMQSNDDFYEHLFNFGQSFQYMHNDIVETVLSSIGQLISTSHSDSAFLCIASFLSSSFNAKSERYKKLKAKAVEIFTILMKNSKFETQLICFIIPRAPTAFSATTLRQLSTEALTQFLKLSLDSIIRANDVTRPLELLLCIIRASTTQFISSFISDIMNTLKHVLSYNKIKIDAILLLNIIGEIGKRKQVPTLLLNDSALSFKTLIPLLIHENHEVVLRSSAILSLLIFGSSDNKPDFELIFSSLMSLYIGYDQNSSHYVLLANELLKSVAKLPDSRINKNVLDLIKHVFSPILSVGDSSCNIAISDLLKFLRSLASRGNDEISIIALQMMTQFAKPKRNIPVKS